MGGGGAALKAEFDGIRLFVHAEGDGEGEGVTLSDGCVEVPVDGVGVGVGSEVGLTGEGEFGGEAFALNPGAAAGEEGVAVDGEVGVEVGLEEGVVFTL